MIDSDLSDVVFTIHEEPDGQSWLEVSSLLLYLMDFEPREFSSESRADVEEGLWFLDTICDLDKFIMRFEAMYGVEPKGQTLRYEGPATSIRALQKNPYSAKVVMH